MAYSMTGVGIGEVETGSYSIRVEIKTVNSRFLEISCRLPSGLARREKAVRDILRSRLERGKIYLQVTLQNSLKDMLDFKVKIESVDLVRQTLENLRKAAGIQSEITLDHILKFSEVFESSEETEDKEDLWADLQKGITKALTELKKMRLQEGDSLVEDIRNRLKILQNNLSEIESISASVPEEQFVKLQERIARLLKDSDMDQDRLKTEIAVLADKSDFTEECVRLRSHFNLFELTIKEESSPGKKLNFLVQELNREVNTIGSKANIAAVNHLCVNMKGEIEKIREQVQNLE